MDRTRADLWEDSPAAREVLLADSKRREEQARKEALEARNTPFVPRNWSAKPVEQVPEQKSWWQVWKGGKKSKQSKRSKKRSRRTRKN